MILLPSPVARRRRIPLTPLIDVIFILIMFFLLSSSFGIWRPLEVSLGDQAGGQAQEEQAEPASRPSVLIVVRPGGPGGQGALTVNGVDIAFADLAGELDRLSDLGAASALLLPQKGTAFQDVVRVLDEARTSRLKRVSLHLQ